MCCFCGESVATEGIDPCALVVFNRWRAPHDEQHSQQFFAHAHCLRNRLVPSAAQNAPVLDPTWDGISAYCRIPSGATLDQGIPNQRLRSWSSVADSKTTAGLLSLHQQPTACLSVAGGAGVENLPI